MEFIVLLNIKYWQLFYELLADRHATINSTAYLYQYEHHLLITIYYTKDLITYSHVKAIINKESFC